MAFPSIYVSILHGFWYIPKYWSKIADSNLLHLYLAPSLMEVIPSEILRYLWHRNNRAPGLSYGVICVILRLVILVQCRLVTDRRTDGQTDGRMTTAYTALAWRRAVKAHSRLAERWERRWAAGVLCGRYSRCVHIGLTPLSQPHHRCILLVFRRLQQVRAPWLHMTSHTLVTWHRHSERGVPESQYPVLRWCSAGE